MDLKEACKRLNGNDLRIYLMWAEDPTRSAYAIGKLLELHEQSISKALCRLVDKKVLEVVSVGKKGKKTYREVV